MRTTTGRSIGMIKLGLLVSDVLTLAVCGPRREKNQKNETRRGGRVLSRVRTILWFRELKIKFISVLAALEGGKQLALVRATQSLFHTYNTRAVSWTYHATRKGRKKHEKSALGGVYLSYIVLETSSRS